MSRMTSLGQASITPLDDERLAWFPSPINLLVGSRNATHNSRGVISHVHSGDLPFGSLVTLGGGLLVCSVEMCLVQLAPRLSTAALLRLVYEVCGSYSVDPLAEGGLIERPALTSVERLRRFVDSSSQIRGAARLRRVLQWAIDGSASPMETNTALLLCLPPREGGYGFELPRMNTVQGAGLRQRSVTRRSCYRCDLFWERAKVAVEYDSDLWHTGAERIASDSARRNELSAMGITVVDVTRLQINDLAEFDRIAHVLARLLGKTLRKPNAKQLRKRAELHRAILFAART